MHLYGRIELDEGDVELLLEQWSKRALAEKNNAIFESLKDAEGRVRFLNDQVAELKRERQSLIRKVRKLRQKERGLTDSKK